MTDLSLHLVTDHRVPFSRLRDIVDQAVDAGVTVVQLRDKIATGGELYARALDLADVISGRCAFVVDDRLDIVLAAGNAYLSEGHVAYARNQATKPETVSWTWRLPPNNSVLCFAEIWMDTSFASRTVVTLTSPSGIVYTPTPVQPPPSPGNPILPPFTGVIAPLPWGNSTVWLLAVQPTGITPAAAAPPTISSPPAEHGDGTLTVEYIDLHAKVDA